MMNLFLFTLLLGTCFGHLYFLLLKTDFLYEYGTVFRMSKWLKLNDYREWKSINNLDTGYPIFIREKYKGFWGTLFGCPFCFITFNCSLFSTIAWVWYSLALGMAAGAIGCIVFLVLMLLYKHNFEKQ